MQLKMAKKANSGLLFWFKSNCANDYRGLLFFIVVDSDIKLLSNQDDDGNFIILYWWWFSEIG